MAVNFQKQTSELYNKIHIALEFVFVFEIVTIYIYIYMGQIPKNKKKIVIDCLIHKSQWAFNIHLSRKSNKTPKSRYSNAEIAT